METRRLYIVGNGFDLWHEIPSAYWQFKEFIKKQDDCLFEAVENYLPTDDSWSDLESSLSEMDVDHIIDDLGHFMGCYGADDWSDRRHHDFQYEVRRIVERLSSELRCQFGQWIKQLQIPTPLTASKRLRSIDPAAQYLTFNYTSTLQEQYGIPDAHILHIHGKANLQDDELILGHAWNPKERRSPNDRPDIDEIDTRLMEANAILDEYFSNTFKPSAYLIQKHRAFFEGLTGMGKVHLLGHSLGEVDEPYFQALLAIPGIASARWQIPCRSNDEAEKKSATLRRIGVHAGSIVICSWLDI
jgi:hypothetical protein